MPTENQSTSLPELPAPVPQPAEASPELPSVSAAFRTVPNNTESFGKIPEVAERKESHTLTVRETARMFESAGVARTERSIINWCQPNRQGITRLDSYFDPNEHKYYITPQSVEAVVQEEIQRSKKSGEATDSESFGSSVAHVKHPGNGDTSKLTGSRKIEELERMINDLKLSNQVKDLFINLLKEERTQVFQRFLPTNHHVDRLETVETQQVEPEK